MLPLLVVGGGLFGSPAATLARRKGAEVIVFDPGLPGAASPAAAGLFRDEWVGRKLRPYYEQALPVLDQLYGLRRVSLSGDDGRAETFYCVPPRIILEASPRRQRVSRVGDGWLETDSERHEGIVYVTAGVWCGDFFADIAVRGKAGAAFGFAGEHGGRWHPLSHGRQALAFVRDPGMTYFSDGTAESAYTPDHDRQTLEKAADLGLTAPPISRWWGRRPYTPGGPLFRRLGDRLWVATGGRKMGTILGAAFAARLLIELKW